MGKIMLPSDDNYLLSLSFFESESEHMRHEILNETDKEKVYRDLLDFFLGHPGSGKGSRGKG